MSEDRLVLWDRYGHVYATDDIRNPCQNDLLLGRGGEINNHLGNVRFRNCVNDFKDRYRAASRVDKPEVARALVVRWRKQDPPGRFLTRTNPGDSEYIWEDIGDAAARRRASKALGERDYKSREMKTSNSVAEQSPSQQSWASAPGEETNQGPSLSVQVVVGIPAGGEIAGGLNFMLPSATGASNFHGGSGGLPSIQPPSSAFLNPPSHTNPNLGGQSGPLVPSVNGQQLLLEQAINFATNLVASIASNATSSTSAFTNVNAPAPAPPLIQQAPLVQAQTGWPHETTPAPSPFSIASNAPSSITASTNVNAPAPSLLIQQAQRIQAEAGWPYETTTAAPSPLSTFLDTQQQQQQQQVGAALGNPIPEAATAVAATRRRDRKVDPNSIPTAAALTESAFASWSSSGKEDTDDSDENGYGNDGRLQWN